jgi:electron transfer flavoprotein alpha subunit
METILVLTAVEADGALPKAALESLAAAKELAGALAGSSLAVGLWGADVKAAADAVAGCGAARFLGVAGPEFAPARYATDAAAAEALAKAAGATIVLAPGTSRLARILPGVAHRLGGKADMHVTALAAGPQGVAATRWYYRQRIESSLTRAGRPWILALDPGCRAPTAPAPGSAAVEAVTVALPAEAKRTTVTGVQAPAAEKQTIRPDAKLLFVTGAGWTKKQAGGASRVAEAETIILGFLKKTQASLGSSKSLVDQSGEGQAVLTFLTHLNQIGQTGATPRHPKGLATCCHGEEPHTVGWRFITQRRAINLDPNCGWARGKADVLYVADVFEVMSKVNALL